MFTSVKPAVGNQQLKAGEAMTAGGTQKHDKKQKYITYWAPSYSIYPKTSTNRS